MSAAITVSNEARDEAFGRMADRVQNFLRRDVPICPRQGHGVMRAYKTDGHTTYYVCKKCGVTGKCIPRIV